MYKRRYAPSDDEPSDDFGSKYRQREYDYKDRMIFDLTKKLEITERKKKHIQRAYYTMVHDIRHEATLMRKYLDSLDDEDTDEESEEKVIKQVKVIAHTMIRLGHCPLSQQPLDENTFVNVCGHIFDKKALFTERPELCPKCSHKIVLPSNKQHQM